MSPEQKGAYDALTFIMPELEKRALRWVITGGFACYVYGTSLIGIAGTIMLAIGVVLLSYRVSA
jgi:hypothetical protein